MLLQLWRPASAAASGVAKWRGETRLQADGDCRFLALTSNSEKQVKVRVYSLASSVKRHSPDFTQLPLRHRTCSFISHLNSPREHTEYCFVVVGGIITILCFHKSITCARQLNDMCGLTTVGSSKHYRKCNQTHTHTHTRMYTWHTVQWLSNAWLFGLQKARCMNGYLQLSLPDLQGRCESVHNKATVSPYKTIVSPYRATVNPYKDTVSPYKDTVGLTRKASIDMKYLKTPSCSFIIQTSSRLRMTPA